MLRIYPLTLALVFVALFTGCSKDEAAASFDSTGQYKLASTITTNPIVMYTRNGIVSNQQVLDNFLIRKQLPTPVFYRNDVPNNVFSDFTIDINRNNQATISYQTNSNTATVNAEITTRTPQYLVLAHTDSVFVGSNLPVDILQENIVLIKRMLRCTTSPLISKCMNRPFTVTAIQNNKLFLPLFAWLIQTGPTTTIRGGLTIGSAINIFNPAIVNRLATGDTIVVQTRELALRKQ